MSLPYLAAWGAVAAELEKLAYEAALRALDKQERLVEELRTRTGLLLAASSVAVSFLGQRAFASAHPQGLTVIVVGSFVASIGAGVFVLVPHRDFVFTSRGTALLEWLYAVRHDSAEVYRRLAYGFDRFWNDNDRQIQSMLRGFRLASVAVMVEVILLSALASGIFG